MTNKARWFGLGIGVLLIMAAFGLVVWQEQGLRSAGVALAQGLTATPAAPQKAATPGAPNKQAQQSAYAEAFWNALAKQLGISVDDLKTKTMAAQKDVIEQMVKDGKLTRAQADRMEQNLNTNQPLGPFFGRGNGRFRGNPGQAPNVKPGNGPKGNPGGFGFGPLFGMNRVGQIEAVAQALNLKPADLQSQLKSGKTLADIATAQNVDQAKVKQAIIDSTKAELQREVTDGLLTQAQADSMLSNLTPDKIDLTRVPFGRWGR
ncbi:MAG: hypothetical protein WCF84_09925 [Anaerolineae bacterium]